MEVEMLFLLHEAAAVVAAETEKFFQFKRKKELLLLVVSCCFLALSEGRGKNRNSNVQQCYFPMNFAVVAAAVVSTKTAHTKATVITSNR